MTHVHVPMRRCVACRSAAAKRTLIRLVHEAGWRIDLRQRLPGRGTSLCVPCALAALGRGDPARLKGFRRAFRGDADMVIALLGTITAALTDDDPTELPVGRAAARPTEAPRTNGGMHG